MRTTPPKGRPTPGKRDTKEARRRAAARTQMAWTAIAVIVGLAVLALFVFGPEGDGGRPAPSHGGVVTAPSPF